VTEAPPGAPRTLPDGFAGGWRTAAVWGAMASGAIVALSVLVGLLAAAGPSSGPEAARQATLVPALVHGVLIDVGPISVRMAFLLATVGVGFLLFQGGRAAARRSEGPPLIRGLLGAAVSVTFAVGSLLVALIALAAGGPEGPALGGGPGEAATPSVAESLARPLVLGIVCGGAGGVSAAAPGTAAERGVRAVLAGGWRATWLAVLIGTAGFLVVMALHPSVVRGYVDAAFSRGAATGTLAVTGTALLLPNAGTGVASASMGGGVEIQVLEASCAVVSYGRIPEGAGRAAGACGRLPFRLGAPAPSYFLFLLLPVVATLAGGWLASRRSGSATTGDGALAGAATGLVFAGLLAVLAAVARVSYEATPMMVFLGGVQVAVGPDPLATFLVGLPWGLAGGAAGGALAARRGNDDGPG
jgi:hypothetical protein